MPEQLTGETLYRNVAPGFFDQDAEEPTAGCLWPSPHDNGQLSTDRAQIWTAKESFEHRTGLVGLPSRGVIEIRTDALLQHCSAPTIANPLTAGENGVVHNNPAHALSDYTAARERVKEQPKSMRGQFREEMLDELVDGSWAFGPIVD